MNWKKAINPNKNPQEGEILVYNCENDEKIEGLFISREMRFSKKRQNFKDNFEIQIKFKTGDIADKEEDSVKNIFLKNWKHVLVVQYATSIISNEPSDESYLDSKYGKDEAGLHKNYDAYVTVKPGGINRTIEVLYELAEKNYAPADICTDFKIKMKELLDLANQSTVNEQPKLISAIKGMQNQFMDVTKQLAELTNAVEDLKLSKAPVVEKKSWSPTLMKK